MWKRNTLTDFSKQYIPHVYVTQYIYYILKSELSQFQMLTIMHILVNTLLIYGLVPCIRYTVYVLIILNIQKI